MPADVDADGGIAVPGVPGVPLGVARGGPVREPVGQVLQQGRTGSSVTGRQIRAYRRVPSGNGIQVSSTVVRYGRSSR